MAHPDLPAEQRFLDRAYDRLEVLRAETQAQLKEAFSERGGTFQSFTERDIRVRNSLTRLEKLQLGREALVFGRIDRVPAPSAGATGEAPPATREAAPATREAAPATREAAPATREAPAPAPANPAGPASTPAVATAARDGAVESFRIGRLAISDEEHEPLVVDWRAPVAEPFYRATGAHPMGLQRRRHFLTQARRITDLEDEVFTEDGADGAVRATGLSGPGVLMAALARAHTGRMRDIVATVQAEQDEVIRAPLPGALVVQGGPGTGKTAVALHRAAYLLYTYRFPLEGQGVLVVGPNPTFLRYIDQVLPSLGETGAELSTASGLYGRTRPSAPEPPPVAHLKGDPRMAQLLRRAVRQRQRPLRRPVRIPYGRMVLTVTPEASDDLVAHARRRSGPHNSRRRALEARLWQYLAAEVERMERRSSGRGAAVAPGQGEDRGPGGEVDAEELAAQLRRRPEVQEMLERMWPLLSAEELLHDFFGAPALVGAAARGLLSTEEAAALVRERSARLAEVRWTAADIALLDEASSLLGPRRSGKEAAPVREYGHIVVDEAQDLTPMQLRMVGRRSLSGSLTLVGDVAQATGPWAPATWDDVVAHLPVRRNWRRAELTVSYRAPAEVLRVAAHVLRAALPSSQPPEPVRDTGERPRVVQAAGRRLAEVVAVTALEEVRAVSGDGSGEDGSVGVLAPAALVDEVASALEAHGTFAGRAGAGALDTQVTLLALEDAKGLEFDAVVVVEPAAVVELPQGMRALYVALTRCTRRLAVVHDRPLPAPLREAVGEQLLPPGASALSDEHGLPWRN